jgi:hypothetical protein
VAIWHNHAIIIKILARRQIFNNTYIVYVIFSQDYRPPLQNNK